MNTLDIRLTVAQDWDATSADDKLTRLANWSLDCYGTDHSTQRRCRILQGTTSTLRLAAFTHQLSALVKDSDIIYFAVSVTPSN